MKKLPIEMQSKRVTAQTKAPYLARVKHINPMKPLAAPILVFIPSIESGYPGPPFARALVVSGIPASKEHGTGKTIILNNFSAIERVELNYMPAFTLPH